MNIIHPSLTNQFSNFNFYSGMLACILNDIFAKPGSITIQSVSETGRKGAGFGTVEEMQWVGRLKSYAEAGGSRAFGRIIQQLTKLCEYVLKIRTEQRARRWRAACPLIDGLPPEINEIEVKIETIFEEGSNGISFPAQISIGLTFDIQDPSFVKYLKVIFNNRIVKKHIQENQQQAQTDSVEIVVKTNYQNKMQMEIWTGDFFGNQKGSGFSYEKGWNFKGDAEDGRWEAQDTSGESKDSSDSRDSDDNTFNLKTTGKTYQYNSNQIELDSFFKAEILQLIYDNILLLTNDIIMHYYTYSPGFPKEYSIRNFYVFDEKWRYAGMALYTFKEILFTRDYEYIKSTIFKFKWYNRPEMSHPFYEILENLCVDISILENTYENNPEVLDDLKHLISYQLPAIFYWNLLGNYLMLNFYDYDGDGLPRIMEYGYGTQLSFITGPSYDRDEDGISDFKEIKVMFRRGLDVEGCYRYGSIAIALDSENKDLIGCGFEGNDPNFNVYEPYNDGYNTELIRKDITPEGDPYLLIKDKINNNYLVYIFPYGIWDNGVTTANIYNSDKPISNHDLTLSPLPNAIFYKKGLERRLCDDDTAYGFGRFRANPIIPDIFVEIDWMWANCDYLGWNGKYYWYHPRDNGGKHQMSNDAKTKVITAFYYEGIRLHIDDGTPGYNMGGGGPIPHIKTVSDGKWLGEEIHMDKGKMDLSEDGLTNIFFTKIRKSIFRHIIIGHYLEESDWGHTLIFMYLIGGEIIGIIGDRIIIAEQKIRDQSSSDYIDNFCCTFMNEIGASVGFTSVNPDPNVNFDYTDTHAGDYPRTCMNYDWEPSWGIDFSDYEWQNINLGFGINYKPIYT